MNSTHSHAAPPFVRSETPLHGWAAPHPMQLPAQPRAAGAPSFVWVLVAMALMALLGGLLGACGTVVGLAAIGASAERRDVDMGVLPGDGAGEGRGTGAGVPALAGVVIGAEVPGPTVDALRARHLLPPDEALLVYHDATRTLDMSDVTLVTADRVVSAHDGVVEAVVLADIASVTHRFDGLYGDIVDITTEDGRRLRVLIAPNRGGHGYVNVLEDAWRKHDPGASVEWS